MALDVQIFSPGEKQSFVVPLTEFRKAMMRLPVKGRITPFSAEVTVAGQALSVGPQGEFSALILLSDIEEGDNEVVFEASDESNSMIVRRTISVQPAPDRDIPVIHTTVQKVLTRPEVCVTVSDRTPDDEIHVCCDIDGSEECEMVAPNTQVCFSFDEGCRGITVEAEDREGNRATPIAWESCYIARPISIRLRQPAGGIETLRLPPGTPDNDFSSEYTLEFSLENCPDDDPSLIREVIVTNTGNGFSEQLKNLTDVDISIDVPLTKNAVNQIRIDVRDINDRIITQSVTIHVQ